MRCARPHRRFLGACGHASVGLRLALLTQLRHRLCIAAQPVADHSYPALMFVPGVDVEGVLTERRGPLPGVRVSVLLSTPAKLLRAPAPQTRRDVQSVAAGLQSAKAAAEQRELQ